MKGYKLILIGLVVFGCSSNETERSTNEYFDLRQLINDQVDLLSSGDYQLKKTAALNEKTDDHLAIPDSLGWINELKLFKDADINRPSLRGVYTAEPGQGEETSNLKEVSYLPVREVKIGVQYLKVFYVEDLSDPRKIEIMLKDVNPLFRSKTILKMELRRDGNNSLVLKNYQITGGQKMILMDSIAYSISGEISRL